MSLLSILFGRNKKSAHVAKERLQLVLAAERATRPARRPDYLPAMQRELLLVVSRYVKIQPKDIRVSVLHHRHGEVLEVKIDLPQAVRA